MKIAILTSGILPVPAVQGGAVENLIDFYLDYNDQHQLHDITVYSIADEKTTLHSALKSKVNHYHYIDTNSFVAKVQKNMRHFLKGSEEYYHYTIEYFLDQTLRQLSRQHYDMIVVENRPGYGVRMPQQEGTKVVYHLHNDFLNSETREAKAIYEKADGIITVSDYIHSRVKTICPTDTKTHTVHNGIDLTAFNPKKFSADRTQFGLQQDDFVMLFSGRITPEKGIMELIEAMDLLQNQPQIKLLILGSSFYGNANDENPFLQKLKEKATPLADRIIFTGFIPYKQMPQYLSIADIAVIPSVWDDPFPTTVLEAQAMGLPIISTLRGGIPEEVTERNAILLSTDERFSDNLAKTILHLFQHPEKRQQMSKIARQHAEQFSKEQYAEHFFSILSAF